MALCPHCYDLVDATDPGDVGTVCTRFREAPQFPSWHCDPRVAVERAPLTGRELFYREQLGEEEVGAQRFDFGANDDVATAAVLALDTPASVAVAFGERLTADAHGWSADEQSPFQAWSDLPPRERLAYERRALDPDAIARSDEWRRRRSSTEFPEGWEQIGLVRR